MCKLLWMIFSFTFFATISIKIIFKIINRRLLHHVTNVCNKKNFFVFFLNLWRKNLFFVIFELWQKKNCLWCVDTSHIDFFRNLNCRRTSKSIEFWFAFQKIFVVCIHFRFRIFQKTNDESFSNKKCWFLRRVWLSEM